MLKPLYHFILPLNHLWVSGSRLSVQGHKVCFTVAESPASRCTRLCGRNPEASERTHMKPILCCTTNFTIVDRE